MIYVGYQGIGKSTLSKKGGFIDLESNNFFIEGVRREDWYKEYCRIAQSLSSQGQNVFLSSHKEVREELKKQGVEFFVIYPSLSLKDEWIGKLKNRYETTGSNKDYKAYKNAENMFEENIKDLTKEEKKIEIKDMNYELEKLITKDNSFNDVIHLSRRICYKIGKELYENQEDANQRAIQIIKICLANLFGVRSMKYDDFDNFVQFIKEKGIMSENYYSYIYEIEYKEKVHNLKCALTYIKSKEGYRDEIKVRFDTYQIYISKTSNKRLEYHINILEEEND